MDGIFTGYYYELVWMNANYNDVWAVDLAEVVVVRVEVVPADKWKC
jgi:hypothetical protein